MMNLRSVFTAEQQRILERYYENGMTNQSKACFQLILQCAQEAKLDFSVVRTWVGNKRRKLASKVEQNGGMSHSLSSHGLAGGFLSSHTLGGGALSSHSLAARALLPAEMAAVRSTIQNRAHLLPPSSSFPSFSSASSSPSSSSPISSGSNNNNNNNDVILTGIYSLNPAPHPRPKATAPPMHSDSELSAHASTSLITQALQSRSSSTSTPRHSKLVSLSQNLPSLTSASGSVVYTAVKKGTLPLGEAGVSVGAGAVPHSWTRQYGSVQTRPWSSASQSQTQLQPRPHSNPQPQPTAPQKTRVSPTIQNSGPASEPSPRIQQVFTLSERADKDRCKQNQVSTWKGQECFRPTPLDNSHNFSIAMETGDEEDEWQREEELATMAAQTHIHREQTSASPTRMEVFVVRGGHTSLATGSRPTLHHSNTTLQGSYSLTAQTSLSGESSSQISLGVSAAPWVINNSRKRTLQERTQFSDGDLIQLKRYWDRGMTSLGLVCREKIAAAANQLNVDTEIVKTWISNRRRKYHLMGIEIPPPKGGPAVFTSSPGKESPVALSPDEERLRTADLGDDLNDGGSICLSEDGTIDSQHQDGEDRIDTPIAASLANDVKIEVIDEDEEDDDYDGELVASDLEQMQSLLEFKQEEVQFLENELENQKQRYQELSNFTRNLLSAVRNNDLERQKELIASLPQHSDQDWDMTVEKGAHPAAVSPDVSFNHEDSPAAAGAANNMEPTPASASDKVPMVTLNEDNTATEVTEPSASEEQIQEAVSELQSLSPVHQLT
ncbi:LOW QUALITY PROTEIN: highly divergent homeobox [Xyrichtys novacula]|uniref:LOW QUALITY PROTEIN: highly divergent homeobox n=1 Tax=Xyrichtys novacula TaxID=13765 RepID=A0AAV1FAV3_XYRNO|nr:LOW QUALITY PROTEIN: highly divergent homeobox [Xyrichtys novacula]